jgi:hypothetical protein
MKEQHQHCKNIEISNLYNLYVFLKKTLLKQYSW